jgi:hypothetical protein
MGWKKIHRSPLGHSFWSDEQGLLAVADSSMRVAGHPETTDDGLILVDLDEIASTGVIHGDPRRAATSFHIPCRNVKNNSERCWVCASLTEAIWVAALRPGVELHVEENGVRYRITKVEG